MIYCRVKYALRLLPPCLIDMDPKGRRLRSSGVLLSTDLTGTPHKIYRLEGPKSPSVKFSSYLGGMVF